jgi:hypothetical protein
MNSLGAWSASVSPEALVGVFAAMQLKGQRRFSGTMVAANEGDSADRVRVKIPIVAMVARNAQRHRFGEVRRCCRQDHHRTLPRRQSYADQALVAK